jgi:hypothetical protein
VTSRGRKPGADGSLAGAFEKVTARLAVTITVWSRLYSVVKSQNQKLRPRGMPGCEIDVISGSLCISGKYS